MTDNIDVLLAERGKVHGDYTEHAQITQDLKQVVYKARNWSVLSPVQREALDMLTHKMGRILAGDPNHRDHWDDISGYSRLAAERVSPAQSAPSRLSTKNYKHLVDGLDKDLRGDANVNA
jgi:hypothetical protein